MRNDQDKNLEILSNIDEDIIDRNTEKRIQYIKRMRQPKKKRWIPVAIVAATISLLAAMVPMLIFFSDRPDPTPPIGTETETNQKQIPIYRGMSIASNGVSLEQDFKSEEEHLLLWNRPNMLSVRGSGTVLSVLESNHQSLWRIMYSLQQKNKPNLIYPSVQGSLYYANPGETIRITIHFDNPDQFEIMSFTLNEKKYATQMFLEGSDMENLIVEYTIDEDAAGMIECTIDAIKYIDGTKIKDVKIGGEQSVAICVRPEQQPTVKVEEEKMDANGVSFLVSMEDSLGLIAASQGNVRVVLYDRETTIAEQNVTVGEDTLIQFVDMEANAYYRYAVIARYDALDGKGLVDHVFYEKEMNIYQLTYVMDGGINPEENPKDYISKDGAVLKQPTKEGYRFVGWTWEGQEEPVKDAVIELGAHGDITFTANWELPMSNLAMPVDGKMIRSYFTENSPEYDSAHLGIDIAAALGSAVYAVEDGVVTNVWEDVRTGYSIEIRLCDRDVYAVYRCLDEAVAMGLEKGDAVKKGDVIAYLGEPTHIHEKSDGPHLHFEMSADGLMVNPLTYFTQNVIDRLTSSEP